MDDTLRNRITSLPEYRELLERKRQLAVPLVIIMLVVYFGFIIGLAFFPAVLSTRIGDGVTTVGIGLGLGIIVLTFALTGFFIHHSEKRLDLLVTIREKAGEK